MWASRAKTFGLDWLEGDSVRRRAWRADRSRGWISRRRGNSPCEEHLVDLSEHLPADLFQPFDRRLDRPTEGVDPQPAHLARHELEPSGALFREPVRVVLALLALADPLEGRGNLVRQGDLQAFVGRDFAAALLAVVLLFQAARDGVVGQPSHVFFRNASMVGENARGLVLFQLLAELVLLGEGQSPLREQQVMHHDRREVLRRRSLLDLLLVLGRPFEGLVGGGGRAGLEGRGDGGGRGGRDEESWLGGEEFGRDEQVLDVRAVCEDGDGSADE